MLKLIRNLLVKKSTDKQKGYLDVTPAGRMKYTADVLPKISLDDIVNCRHILHRTSVEVALKIIRTRKIWSHNSAVSFSINPGQTNQAEQKGSMLLFNWRGPVSISGAAKQNELLHVLSPGYVESLIDRPSNGNFLFLIGIIEPDIHEVEVEGEDAMGQVRSVINDRIRVFSESIIIDVV